MIAIQKTGKSFAGALAYNLSKMQHPDPALQAVLLDSNFAALDRKLILREVNLLRQLRPNLQNYVYHTSLNLSKEEAAFLDDGKLLAIARDYLAGMGFDSNPCLIFRHYDAEHPHVHVLTCRIRFDGSVVSDSHNYRRSEAVVRGLEQRYGLLAVQGSRQAQRRAPKKDELEMVARTGEASGKMALQAKLNRILQAQNMTMTDFILRAQAQGISLLFNQSPATGKVSGITYLLGDFKAKGQALGQRFKWSELIQHLDYEKDRDGPAIGRENDRTTQQYGRSNPAALYGAAGSGAGRGTHPLDRGTGAPAPAAAAIGAELGGQRPLYPGERGPASADDTAVGADQDLGHRDGGSPAADLDSVPGLYIAHDEDETWRRKRSRRSGR